MPIEIQRCVDIAEELCKLFDSDKSNSQLEEPTMSGLRFLWDQSNVLFDLIQSRPESKGRSGEDYFDGVKLGELAKKIADKLDSRNLKNLREIALRIRMKAILQVQGHYPHIIGPAMLEHSELLEALNRVEEAVENYDCIVSDFSWLLDDYNDDEAVEDEDDYIALQSFKEAITRILRIGASEIGVDGLKSSLRKVEYLLQKSDA